MQVQFTRSRRRTRIAALKLGGALVTLSGPTFAQPDPNPPAQDARQSVDGDAPPAAPRNVSPEAVARAEELAAQAIEAYRAGEARRAIALYLEAFELAPSADILFNVARVYDLALDQREPALKYYRRSAAQPDAVPERKRKAELRAKQLEQLARDEAVQGDWPVVVATAQHPSAESGVADGSRRGGVARKWTSLGLGVAGAASLGVGTWFGLRAMRHAERARDNCDGNACASQRGVDETQRARDAATVATVGFVAGGTLIGAATWLLLTDDGDQSAAEETAMDWQPVLTSGGAGLLLRGEF